MFVTVIVSPIENPKSAGGGLGGLRMTKSVNEMATVSPNGSAFITVKELQPLSHHHFR